MARCVLDEGGILDKFTGDGIMAIFAAMSDPTDGALAAARSALAMRRSIGKLNASEPRAARSLCSSGWGSTPATLTKEF